MRIRTPENTKASGIAARPAKTSAVLLETLSDALSCLYTIEISLFSLSGIIGPTYVLVVKIINYSWMSFLHTFIRSLVINESAA